ncbi:uncharacterized protein [Hetaerina americana]|uniref:uncharacterized protein n=1 Tax=Hetaerina americana TaxID=62018 RepID=UPI003A7F2692
MGDLSSLVTREEVLKALRGVPGREDVHLLDDYTVERASSGVEGFTSIILRVKVSYRLPGYDQAKSHVFFVKTMPQFEYQRELMKTSRVFSKEWLVFSEVAPLMAKVSAGRVTIPLPACYHGICTDDTAIFYMEDLVDSGYRAAGRSYLSDGLDYAHCSLVMKGLGKLHALSLAAEKTLDPGKGGWAGAFPEFNREFIYYIPGPGDPPVAIQNMVDSMIQNFKELCREVDGLPKEAEASGALERVLEGVWPTLCRLKETPPNNRNVLVHGDCWMNNMMFRYEKGEEGEAKEPVAVKFFDLQRSKCCHPSIDLLYFMYLSTRRPFREKYFSTLIDEYHSSLTENLEVLGAGFPPFSLVDFKEELMGEYKPFGLIICMFYSPIMLLGDEFLLPNADDMTADRMEEFFTTGSTPQIRLRFHSDPKFRSIVEDIVREFVDMALPNGLESVDSSPLLRQKVN